MNDNDLLLRTIACRWCGSQTLDVANVACDRCLQLSMRIRRDLPLAKLMVAVYERHDRERESCSKCGRRLGGKRSHVCPATALQTQEGHEQ